MDTRNITRFLKGFAILLVFLCHSHQFFAMQNSAHNIFSFLQIGVQLFIILSAMGLCFSYSKTPVNWFGFIKKRLSKIAVMYWCAIALAAVYRVLYAFFMHQNIIKSVNFTGVILNALLLHGFSNDPVINNTIVRGGWFIGTIVILYALFPLMYRLYFYENKTWKKIRTYIFPLTVFAVTYTIVIVLNHFVPQSTYIKQILQFAPFSLGFPLFELQTNSDVSKIKLPLFKSVLFFIGATVLFFTKIQIYIFSVAIAFFYLIIFILKTPKTFAFINSKSLISRFLNAMGENSFAIYLTHSYIAFDFCRIANHVLCKIYNNGLLWFIILQPVAITLTFYLGKIFNKIVSYINKSK